MNVDNINVTRESNVCIFMNTCTLMESQTTGENSRGASGAHMSVIKNRVFLECRRECLSSLSSVVLIFNSQVAGLWSRKDDESTCDRPVRATVGSFILYVVYD